eukprot:jgi/Phyca11/104563/e_gw1.9.818.1
MGRILRTPNELLRATSVTEAGDLTEYHQKLVKALEDGVACAEEAREKEQRRQAKYYNKRTRQRREFKVGDRVWMFRPPRGAKASKLVHNWIGPLRVMEPAGFDNFLLRREDQYGVGELIIAHLADEDEFGRTSNAEATGEAMGAATAHVNAVAAGEPSKRTNRTVSSADKREQHGELMVELRRRKRRNAAGQYVLEVELQPISERREKRTAEQSNADGGRVWVSMREYEMLFQADRVVEDSECGEGV